ncbi:MAG: dihydrolipoyl dehydrogenase [Janthinobacterium lividum]
MDNLSFDVIVIGAGPAGYVAAIKAAQLGLKVACVDKRGAPGGTCLNVGCIPSKVLLNSTHKLHEAQTKFADHGIDVESVTFDLSRMMKRKEKIVAEFTQGVNFLFKKNNVTFFQGGAAFLSPTSLKVVMNDGQKKELSAQKIVIATGSAPILLPGVTIDEKIIVTSTGALSLGQVPKNLVIIGGGYIGLEIGSVWQRLGSQVTVVEYQETIVPQMDREVAALFLRSLKISGINFKLSTKVLNVKLEGEGAVVEIESLQDQKIDHLRADVVLLSMGRKAFTEGLDLEHAGLQADARGMIDINDQFQTKVSSIYAIGDVVRGPMLAHKGEEEGVAVAEIIAGQKPHVNYDTIPAIVYTHPEIATVGKTEEQLKAASIDYKIGKFPFIANSRAKVNGDIEGFVKILSDRTTDEVLGVHIIHAEAGSLIAEAVIAMEYRASAEDIARTCHAHPTVSEAVKEAAMAASGKAIHI